MRFRLTRLLFKVMDLKTITQTKGRYFWPFLSIAFLIMYMVSHTYDYELNKRTRRYKLRQAELNPSISSRYLNRGKHFTTQNVSEEIIGNIVYPQVDTSNFPPIDESECPLMMTDIELAPAYSMPLTALASFPRSGNTWSRFLLQVATKYYTGTVFWETEGKNEVSRRVLKGGVENYTLQKGVCIKTHFFEEEHIASFDNGAILLIRNPYHSLISEFMRVYSRLRNVSEPEVIQFLREKDNDVLLSRQEESLQMLSKMNLFCLNMIKLSNVLKGRWTKEFHQRFQNWRNTALNWINHCKRLMIVFYEDLAENPVRELTRMVAFLGQPIQPRRIQCAVHNYKPMNSSQHKSRMDFDPYTPEMYKQLDSFIAEVNETLIRKNARPLPTYKKYYLPDT